MEGAVILLFAGRGGCGDAEQPHRSYPLLPREAFPETHPGEFVLIINELTDQWAARRKLAAQQPIKRNLEVVR